MATLTSLICVKDFEREASKLLPRAAFGYYKSGATTEQTLRENESAFQSWYIRPRILNDVSKCDLTTTILGHEVQVPFGVAPTAMQKMAHPDGECANAKAAARMGTVFTLSTIATSSIEEVALEEGLKFFQLYIYKNSITTLPIILKGILTAEDAIMGLKMGASAIWVSNHGARQIDGVSPSIEALPDIVEAIGRKCEVYLDGGIRTGTDVFKALALGARMVFLGRPLIWGLCVGGSDGAYKVLNVLKNELQSTIALAGFSSVKAISNKAVMRRSSKL